MKNVYLLLILSLSLLGCHSYGSWYKTDPLPTEQMDLSEVFDQPYTIERVLFQNNIYDLVIIDLSQIDLKIKKSPDPKGLSLMDMNDSEVIFATNGGMFREDRTPLGYFSNNGEMHSPLNRADGYGNFYLKPNGVFFITDSKAQILETEDFYMYLQAGKPTPDIATQSGPLLLHKSSIHRAFKENSTNKYVRNGVGIIDREKKEFIVFAISNRPVNFYDFSIFFRDFLHCSDALYLDGHISAMYLPDLNRNQNRKSLGTVIYALDQ